VLRMSVWDEVDPMPDNLPIVQIGLNDWEIGKNYPTELAIGSDVRETLRALTPVLKEQGGSTLSDAAEKRIAAVVDDNWSARRAKLVEKISAEGSGTPINPDWLMLKITEALPDNAIVINEGVTATRYLNDLRPYRDRYDYHGLASGGIGWGIPASVGVQLAHPERPVCAIVGDGSSMYSIQALWSAANQKLPMTYIIVNNGGYRIIKQRLLSFHKNDHFIGMDFKDPEVNFAVLAKSMGVEAHRVEDPSNLSGALESALANRSGPNLVEVVCDGSV